MKHLSLMSLVMALLWVVFNTYYSQDLELRFLSINCLSSCIIHQWSIGVLWNDYFCIYVTLLIMISSFLVVILSFFLPSMMWIELVILDDQTSTSVYILFFFKFNFIIISFLEGLKGHIPLLAHPLNLNIELLHRQPLKLYGSYPCLMNFIPLTQQLVIYYDNMDITYHCVNPIFHSHMKHIEIHFHFICDKV